MCAGKFDPAIAQNIKTSFSPSTLNPSSIMKSIKAIILSVSVAAAISGSADAQTVVTITGSTAFRSSTHNAIKNLLTASGTPSVTHTGSSLSSASQAIFKGSISGTEVIIKTGWSGSVAGVQTVSQATAVNFLPNSVIVNGTTTTGASTGTESLIPDVAMSDTFQSATPFTTPTLNSQTVGVIAFKWVASKGSPAGLTNMTQQLAQALFGNGSLALALFTGNSADQTSTVFATGRDPLSGTRLTTFAESGVGVASTVVQYKPTVASGAVTSQSVWPAETVNGIAFDQGNGGYTSGSSLVTALQATTSGIGGYYVSYMGVSDADSAITGGAIELTWNGIQYSLENVKQGKYTFWGYQHLMYQSTLTGTKKTVADAIATQIKNVDSPILLSDMKVERQADGGLIAPKY
jgi:hypothetical protein